MAKANTTSAAISISIADRVAHALEMATEISAESSRLYSLATALTSFTNEHSTERGLSEVLEDRLGDKGQLYRLIDCLANIKKEVCHG